MNNISLIPVPLKLNKTIYQGINYIRCKGKEEWNMAKKGRQNKVSEATANPTVAADTEFSKELNVSSAKQAKKK
jgi:hypothetical protein